MPFFRYRAYTPDGKEITNIEEAPSLISLRKSLIKKGYIPLELEEIEKKLPKKNILRIEIFKRKISQEELSLLLYELGLLIKKGVHITQALSILSVQTGNEKLQNALLLAKTSIEEGNTIAQAFENVKIFPEFLIEMIKVGEEAGALDKIFLSTAKFIERQSDFKSKVINSLIYPTIVIIVGFIATIIIMNVVVPTITKIYSQFGKELPTMTKIIVYFSKITDFFIKLSPLFLLIGIIFRQKLLSQENISKIKLSIPFFKKVHLFSIYSTWTNTLSLLLKGGVTIDKAIEIANKTISNKILQREFEKIVEDIKKGKSLSKLLKEKKLLPENAIQLITIGEETAQLEDMLQLISEIYKKQTERYLSLFLSYLEPVTLIILSVLIGFFVFATLLPIFSLSTGSNL